RRWVDFADSAGFEELIPDMLRSEFYKHYANRGGHFRRHMAGMIAATPLTGLRHTLSEVLGKRTPLFRMRNTLRAIKAPTLVLLGQQDYVCRHAAHLLRETIRETVLHLIPGAGHMAPLERPRAFNAAVAAFLAEQPIPNG